MPASKVQFERICPICGTRFLAKTLYSIYCSSRCSKVAFQRNKAAEEKEKRRQELAAQIPNDRDYISVPEACNLYGISKATIYRLIRLGRVEHFNAGQRLIRISRSSIEKMYEPKADVNLNEKIEIINGNYRFDSTDCYTVGEISTKYGLHDTTIWQAIRKFSIPTCQRGNYVFVPKDRIDQIFKNQ